MLLRSPLLVGVLLFACMAEASAAALTRVVTSAGALAVLGALLVMKSWPAQLSMPMWPTAGGAVAFVGAALWWWRLRASPAPAGMRVGARPSVPFAAVVDALPPPFDREDLLTALRRQFVALQVAWDRGDMVALGALTTPDLLAELCLARPVFAGPAGASESTDVVTVQADLLAFEALGTDFVVSVEFSGLIRESAHAAAVPFRELWMLTRSNGGADGWRLARHQALL